MSMTPVGGATMGAPHVWIASITIALDVLELRDWEGLMTALSDLSQFQKVAGPYPNGVLAVTFYHDDAGVSAAVLRQRVWEVVQRHRQDAEEDA